jgi:hypothetical protein
MIDFQKEYPVLIPYKIDFSTRTVGKHIRQTKRHVNWRFGFAHVPSLLDGKTGTACRGIEMDVHVIWSVASGKHEMYLNGQLVHHKLHSKIAVIPTQKFDYSVNVPENIIPGMHVMHVTAWALGLGEHSNENQFRFEFDGENYKHFFGIFELGLPNMMFEYSKPLEIARKKLSQRGSIEDKSDGSSISDILDGRPRRSMVAKSEENQSSEVKYWKEPIVNVLKRRNSPSDSRSGSMSSSRGFKSQDVATTDEDERRLIAEARALSLRELEETRRKRLDREEEQRQLAQARLNSFRDLNVSNDDMSVPSFARPSLVSRPHKPYNNTMGGGLQPVEEDKDLLDLDFDDTSRPANLVRRQSSVTLDTALRDDFGTGPSLSNDDDISLASETYSHLDPRKMWKTQQDVSFIFQRPPVYADSLAGDLIQPSSSFSTSASFYGNPPPISQSPMMYAGRHMGYGQNVSQKLANPTNPQSVPGPRPKTPPNFQAPPPPTFAVLNEAFGPTYGSSNYGTTNNSYAPPTNGSMNYPNSSFQNSAATFR